MLDRRLRAALESAGVCLVPSGYYYPVPTLQDIEESFEYREPRPFFDGALFDKDALARNLRALLPFAREFDPPTEGDCEEPDGYHWGASTFSDADAMAYYCMLRRARPRRVVEVGAGFSTLIATQALGVNGRGRVLCVDPEPPGFLAGRPGVTLLREKAQDLNPGFFNRHLKDGDVLFIDSTHTVKTGSDVVHLYLRVLPRLTSRVLVHVHDVFFPRPLPKPWLLERHLYWGEPYLLYAYLLDNPRVRVLFGSTLNRLLHRRLLEQLMQGKSGAGGASLWFELRPPRRKR